jgi:hypothetical protein
MTKKEIPVVFVMKGMALAYSEDELKDRVEENVRDIGDALFDNKNIAYSLVIEGKEVLFTGENRAALVERIAMQLHQETRDFCLDLLNASNTAAEMMNVSSGIIFKHQPSVEASNCLKKRIDNLAAIVGCSFHELPATSQRKYIERAEKIIYKSRCSHINLDKMNFIKEE